jgi:hypothetical protein
MGLEVRTTSLVAASLPWNFEVSDLRGGDEVTGAGGGGVALVGGGGVVSVEGRGGRVAVATDRVDSTGNGIREGPATGSWRVGAPSDLLNAVIVVRLDIAAWIDGIGGGQDD